MLQWEQLKSIFKIKKRMDKKEEKILREIRVWVSSVCPNADHLLATEKWLLKLDPKTDLASQVAALTHDIERAFQKDRNPPKDENSIKWDDSVYGKWHGERSADFVEQELREMGINDDDFIKETKNLIEFHEFGGDTQKDLIKDSDSLSFLEVNIPLFISWIPGRRSKEDVREKVDYMFNRISSIKAKKLAQPYYNKAMSELEKI